MAANDYTAVINAVNTILNDTILSGYTEDVVSRLVSFGFVPTTADAAEIAFSMMKGHQHVLNETNQKTVPAELKCVCVDMICGEFLNVRHLTGRLSLSGLDFSGIVTSVNEGDTSVSYAAEGSDESKFTNLMNWMISGKGCDLTCYRRIKW